MCAMRARATAYGASAESAYVVLVLAIMTELGFNVSVVVVIFGILLSFISG